MRSRLGMAVVAALLVVLASGTLVTGASGSSPKANRSRAAAAQVTPLTISPIQQMVFNAGEDGSSRSDRAGATAAVVGEGGDGHLAGGFCRLQR